MNNPNTRYSIQSGSFNKALDILEQIKPAIEIQHRDFFSTALAQTLSIIIDHACCSGRIKEEQKNWLFDRFYKTQVVQPLIDDRVFEVTARASKSLEDRIEIRLVAQFDIDAKPILESSPEISLIDHQPYPDEVIPLYEWDHLIFPWRDERKRPDLVEDDNPLKHGFDYTFISHLQKPGLSFILEKFPSFEDRCLTIARRMAIEHLASTYVGPEVRYDFEMIFHNDTASLEKLTEMYLDQARRLLIPELNHNHVLQMQPTTIIDSIEHFTKAPTIIKQANENQIL